MARKKRVKRSVDELKKEIKEREEEREDVRKGLVSDKEELALKEARGYTKTKDLKKHIEVLERRLKQLDKIINELHVLLGKRIREEEKKKRAEISRGIAEDIPREEVKKGKRKYTRWKKRKKR